MAPSRSLGGHRILKELSRDSLGRTYRAARGGEGDAIGDLVLLRTFEGLGADALEAEAGRRDPVWPRLPHVPFLGLARNRGREGDIFYLAFDYEVEVAFDRLLEADAEPLTPELALLVADRVAQALVPLVQEGTLHGFVVPPLVHLSRDGEVRLLGAEIGPRLLSRAADRYPETLAPEHRSDPIPTESGQVYSLGSLLFAALVGATPPLDVADRLDEVLNAARLADDGHPLPQPLIDILHRSLAPADRRIQKVETWQQALKQTVAVTGFQANPFQLAMYMHRRLESRLAREPEEIAVERAGADVASPTEKAPAPVEAAALPSPPIDSDAAEIGTATSPETSPRRRGWLAAVLVAGILGAGAVAWLVLGSGPGEPPREEASGPEQEAVPRPGAASVEVEEEEPVPDTPETEEAPAPSPALSEEELESRIDALVAERERELSEEHARRLATLEAQLDETRRRAAASDETPVEEEPEPAPPPSKDASTGGDRRALEPSPPAPSNATPEASESVRPETVPTEPATAPSPAPGAAENEAAAVEPSREPAGSEVSEPEPRTSSPPPATRTRRGDLVLPGPSVRPPRLLKFPEPDYPPVARRRGVEGTVVLKVLVDENGRVAEVEVVKGVVPDVGLDAAAVRAAERARFTPATKDGVAVKTFYTLTIPFSLSAPRQ